MWHIVWYTLLGLLLAGYLALDGITLGTGIVGRALARDEAERRTVAAATGPFFLGNEVWLIAAGGIVLGGFPGLESSVISGLYPLVVLAVGALLVREAATQFRRRVPGARWRGFWDGLVLLTCLLLALTWGALGGALLGTLPLRGGHLDIDPSLLLRPVPVLSALTAVAVFALHATVFLAVRAAGPLAERAVSAAGRLAPAAAGLAVLTAAAAVADGNARDGLLSPLPAALLLLAAVAALLLAPRLAAHGRRGLAPLASGFAALAPVLILGAAHYPQALVSGAGPHENLSVAEAAADPSTLGVVGPVVLFVLPVLLAFQAMQWWAFRGRTDDRSPAYF
ncbi:cytochrome d ubiquinol oxidase subunit II [Streptomyces roseicoloratus]|uniref:cytochrome d ubiquinol oxidase subunit II n=1 Tax=Streptomyces roseicoloratus TaxID=2508722 RepID=UPI0013E923BB|nr:cytochrome d ubiquinol oxidase subunit II [Streptomyces roseicoloratus]